MGIFDKLFKKNENESTFFTCKNGVIVRIDELLNNNLTLGDFDLYLKCVELQTDGYISISLPKEQYKKMLEDKQEYDRNNYLIQKTAELNNKGIELERIGDKNGAILAYEENISLGLNERHSFDRLGVIYRRNDDIENQKRVLKRYYEVFNLPIEELEAKLKLLTDKHNSVKPVYLLPKEPLTVPQSKTNPLGAEFEEMLRKIPEFDFYKDKPDNICTLEFQLLENKKLHEIPEVKRCLEINRTFMDRITQGEEYEKLLDLARAAEIYEQMVSDKCQKTAPYDRLIKIYAKAKLPIHERRVLELAIKFFTELKQRQTDYITELARKANKLDFCLDRIEQKQKIFYYSGIFELYNPYTIIDKWIERLEKLNKKIQ